MKLRGICVLVMFLPLAVACSARIEGTVQDTGAANLTIEAALESRTAALIRSLSRMMGAPSSGGTIIDGDAIGRSMEAAPGIASVSFHNTGPAALAGTITIARLDAFLSQSDGNPAGGGRRFITYEGGSSARLLLELDRQSAPSVLSRLSPEVSDYLSALMAPALTGEALSRRDYLTLVASIYGSGVADEIAQARITANIEFPRPIQTIRGGTAQGRQVRLEVPLLDILVLDTPLRYEVLW